ncbi:MAG: PQQ-dependent sugar dehydrogenase [Flavobacteriales bacterium]|nr:PQQ-dependent sugar dehydrogenase [Flavobacteriales bacterium]
MRSPLHAQTVPTDFADVSVVNGFNEPVGAAWDANGRMYVWEKQGKVWIVDNGVTLPTPLLDISPEVGNWRDHGMLGFALDPQFLSNGRIYVMYTVDRHYLMNYGTPAYDPATNDYYSATIMRITRYTAIGPNFTSVDPNSRTILLGETKKTGIPLLYESHSTGTLLFGEDGTLMVSCGDGADYGTADGGNDPTTYYAQALTDSILRTKENVGAYRSQLVDCLNGKILRLDPNTGDGVPSNPYYDPTAPRAPRSRVWALGLRNPYRMTLRPGTGSPDPADGDPGSLYIGDVGWNTWEELNVCTEAGMNFGWPLYEGMTAQNQYQSQNIVDLDAPNPLYDGVNCTQQYFYFKDLLKQDDLDHLNKHPNPCNPAVQIPSTIPHFFHSRPEIDWLHGNESRCGDYSGNTAVTFDLDDPNSPVPGPRFGGQASLGGVWVDGASLPQGYQNVYFNADYVSGWIRRFAFDTNDKPLQVYDFASNLGPLTWVGSGPDGCIWYINYLTNAVRRICYTQAIDLPPVAAATQSVQYGPGPLQVSFNGSASYDPEGGALTYAWDFGDGGSSSLVSPMHTFTAPANTPTTYGVTLTVTDNGNQTGQIHLIVSVNNTPPNVDITSIVDGSTYPIGVDTVYVLEADVTDAEHTDPQLTYSWRTILHHNSHTHPEAIDHNHITSSVISGVGCDGETYYFEVTLTVTDPGGLSATDTKYLYPRCQAIPPTALIQTDIQFGPGPLQVHFDGAGSYDPGGVVGYAWDFGDGGTSTDLAPTHTFTDTGDHLVTLTVTDGDGLTGVATTTIGVVTLEPPQCPGASGSVLREYWTGVGGGSVSDLLNYPSYPDSPNGTTHPTQFKAPTNFGNNYGTRMRGYIVPATTGTYHFTLTSDDASVAYLSANAEPKYKQQICSVPGYTGETQLDKYGSQRSNAVTLQAGVYYYVEVLHKEGSGGDHLTLWWEGPGIGTPTIIPGTYLVSWQDCAPSTILRVELQGAFDAQSGLMRDALRSSGYLPTSEPYTGLGYTQAMGGGGETVPGATLNITGSNAIVDWVLVELRDKNDPTTIVATKCALVQRDGDVVGVDGYPRLLFNVPADQYYVAVRHRNHLGVMTAAPQVLGAHDRSIDLTLGSTSTYGSSARKQLTSGRYGLWSGNVTNDGALKYTGANNDRDPILTSIGGLVPTAVITGYHRTDVNMDGLVKYAGADNDRDPIIVNIGGAVPTAVRLEQLP